MLRASTIPATSQKVTAVTEEPHKLPIPSVPELGFLADWNRSLQLGVKVVVDAFKLTHSNPMTPPHRKGQKAQAHVGWDIDDEAKNPCQGELL